MTARVKNLEKSLIHPPLDDDHLRELESLSQQQENARQDITELETEAEAHRVKLAGLEEQQRLVGRKVKLAAETHADNVPRVQHSISLYATISGIRWDYSKDETIAGVVNTDFEVREFELDPKTMTRYEITESLWEMIDPR